MSARRHDGRQPPNPKRRSSINIYGGQRTNHISRLPPELLCNVLRRVDDHGLARMGLQSQFLYEVAMPLLWGDITLMDRRGSIQAGPAGEHDDTPIIQLLLTLASNKRLAALVRTLHHQCYLPPHVWTDSHNKANTVSRTLSCDMRTLHLVKLAAANLVNLETLSIDSGHHNLTQALFKYLFGVGYPKPTSLKRLVLRDTSLSFDSDTFADTLDFCTLHTMDIQRSTVVSGSQGDEAYLLTRHGEVWQYIDEFYLDHEAPIADVVDEIKAIEELEKRRSRRTKNPIFHPIFSYDDRMYDSVKTLRLAEAALIPAVPDNWVDRLSQLMEFAHGRPMRDLKYLSLSWVYRFSGIDHSIFPRIHPSAAKTLTSISLDWEAVLIDTAPMRRNTSTISRLEGVLVKLFSSTFPCLISFRFRSARPAYQITVPSLYLLDVHRWVIRDTELGFSWNDELTGDLGLAFLERHPHLKELTWPGDRFFASRAYSDDQQRSSQIIDDLAVQLSRLEVDRCDLARLPPHHAIVQQRLERFIVETASKMLALRHLKIGGGIPNSYMREMIRSCRRSAIREVALNGMIWPGGLIGSWDNEERTPRPIAESHWIKPLRSNLPFLFEDEPDEDQTALDAIHNLNDENVDPRTAKYSPYVFHGEPRNEAMLQAIACYYSDTIETLSLLGFIGCPILRNNDNSQRDPFLKPLKHFHNLRFFETTVVFNNTAMRRETFVPNHYWENLIAYIERRRPIPSPTRIWGREIMSGDIAEETENAAGRYAKDVFEKFAGHLSSVAKGRQDGVCVRAVIATGYVDLALDVWIGLRENGQDRLLRWSQLYRWRDEDHVHEHIKRPGYTMRA